MANIEPGGSCKKCKSTAVNCKYNFFEQGDLVIHSWEHKCLDCGHRSTTAYRSDDEDEPMPDDATICPYCGRSAE
tara:strand:- start:310 stop:534 length:225 start_codon:yes stop_codon:yes gene_type:complete